MVWNHRVIRKLDLNGDAYYHIHEVYYPEVGAKPDKITVEPMTPYGDTVEDLRWTLEKMLECLDKPILDYKDF